MRLTIERMGYGADGIAHTDEGKTVFVAGGVVGDVVDAELTSDGPSFSRARATNIIEPSGMRVTPPCPFVGVCGGCPWGALGRETQLHAKEENLRSALQRIGHFTPEEINDLVQPIRYTKDAWGYRNKVELGVHSENGRLRLGMHGIDPDQIIKVDRCPLFESTASKAIKAVTGALSYLGNSRDLNLERVGIRASRRTKALEVALWTPTGGFPRAHVARVLDDAVKPTSVVRVLTKGDRAARRVEKTSFSLARGLGQSESARKPCASRRPRFSRSILLQPSFSSSLSSTPSNPGPTTLRSICIAARERSRCRSHADAAGSQRLNHTAPPFGTCAATSSAPDSTTSTRSEATRCANSPATMPTCSWSTPARRPCGRSHRAHRWHLRARRRLRILRSGNAGARPRPFPRRRNVQGDGDHAGRPFPANVSL